MAEASVAAAEYKGWDISKLRAVVQGFGSMGGSSARYLARLGARIVGVVDVNGAVTNPDGLDVELLLRSRTTLGEIDRSALRPGDLELPRERWLEIDADIVVPAAVADAITAENSAAIKARMVVEAANIPTTDDAQRLLHQRGVVVIPDYVANGGANAWWWWTLLGVIEADAEQSFAHVSKVMRETVRRMLELADARHITPRDAANELSMENLDRLAGISDGIFAVGMTLLVLNLADARHLLGRTGNPTRPAGSQQPALLVDPARLPFRGHACAVLDRAPGALSHAHARARRVLAQHRSARHDAARGTRVRPTSASLPGRHGA